MVRSIAELRKTPDEVLVAEHDAHARNTVVGTGYYMDELERRSRERATEASNRLARRGFWLAVVSTVSSLAALVVAIIAILMSR